MPPFPLITAFFHDATNSISYLIVDPVTYDAAIIDPVLDFDPVRGEASTTSAEQILATAALQGARVVLSLETHIHADHPTAAAHIKARTGALVGIGAQVAQVQAIFAPRFGITPAPDDFDLRLEDNARLKLGALEIEVLHVPGHTPADMAYKIADSVFTGDTIFMPDFGTARTDFPGGDARALYRSISRLLALPPQTRLFCGHDYTTATRDVNRWESTVAEHLAHNIHLRNDVDEESFVTLRQQRDAVLSAPRLLLPSLCANIRAGRLPEPAQNAAAA